MANRIPPPEPESNRISQARKLEEAQKIAAISSVDPDAQAKKRRFQQMMEPSESETTEEPLPTPYQTSFYQSKEPVNLNLNTIPTPSNSQPPDLNALSPQAEDLISDEGLPQSPEYWNQVDLPDQPIEQQPQLSQETSMQPQQQQHRQQPQELQEQQSLRKKTGAGKKQSAQQGLEEQQPRKQEKKLEESPFGPPGKAVSKKENESKEPPPFVKKPEEMDTSPFGKKKSEAMGTSSAEKKKTEREAPPAKYWETPQEQIQSAPGSTREKGKDKIKEQETASQTTHHEKPFEPPQTTPPKDFSPFFQKAEAGGHGGHGEHGSGRGRESKATVDIIQPATPGFPSTVHAEATSATTAASPYLRPEVVPLFYQMVGTIFTMTNQGVSSTEILLNNPAFAGSKFFGASIEIIKYSSAPDSLNIKLSGSNEAVTAFNQNIPGLMAAFQTGGFRFRVGRIEASYAAEKPVFRRKKGKEDTFDEQNPGKGE